MCGIAGYITETKTNYKHAVAVAILAKHMDERGGHSWGTMDHSEVEHGLGDISLGLTVNAAMPQTFALHTRYGTTGARVVENSHPFTLTGTKHTVVGMHNGIISNHAELNRSLNRSLVVDSQHIFQNIADGRSLDNLIGYGAIVYRIGTQWYIGRFNDGEMQVVLTCAGLFFASTKDAIMEAMSFAGLTIQKWLKVKNNTVYRVDARGLSKAYRVDAGLTQSRWNDSILSSYRTTQTPVASSADIPHVSAASKHKESFDEQCDWCGAYGVELWSHKREAVCADCYYEVTNEIPAGFDASEYFNAH